MRVHAEEDVREIFLRVHVVRDAAGNQRVEPGEVLSRPFVSDEEIVPAAERCGPQVPL
jgi:hypothetical protein